MQRRENDSESGMTFVELMVAATLMGLFALFLAPAGQMLHGVLGDVERRTGGYQSAQLARARFFADARQASTIDCVTGDKVVMSVGEMPSTTVEYRVTDERLIRWSFPPDKDFLVAEGLSGISCNSLGDEGIEVDLAIGDATTPFHLHLMVAEVAQTS